MSLTFQKELFRNIMRELTPLFIKHDAEASEDTGPIDPDWERYCNMELAGQLHVITARDNRRLVGYFISVIATDLHRKYRLNSYSDLFYMLPEYRFGWDGMKLFTETEKMLKSLGVRKSYLVTKVKLPVTIFIKRLKYILVEQVHIKNL